ncbi:MAG TPA: hypothetical protein VFV89_19095 [Nocardioides sp.]|uniref:hypothetical protein n=1 Tax=Nocardioides sp. TaxID=35761 RepID=UPI002E37171A|nr:hypothetical protein [Nocardioides sp.]HEX5089923.1 hypothetical protein [Nocardioides sp.]
MNSRVVLVGEVAATLCVAACDSAAESDATPDPAIPTARRRSHRPAVVDVS